MQIQLHKLLFSIEACCAILLGFWKAKDDGVVFGWRKILYPPIKQYVKTNTKVYDEYNRYRKLSYWDYEHRKVEHEKKRICSWWGLRWLLWGAL